jgi:hypothetical protein
MQEDPQASMAATKRAGLPTPPRASRWRWANGRRAAVGGGVLAAVLSLGSVSAGAATTHGTKPPAGSSGRAGPGHGHRSPTAAGKITALSGDDITISSRGAATEVVVYSSTTTFRTASGTATASDLKVGDFIAVEGSRNGAKQVAATRITISTRAPGVMGGGPGGRAKGAPPTSGSAPTG